MRRAGKSGQQSFARNITRRDFINGVAVGTGSAFAGLSWPATASNASFELGDDWYGYGGVGSYKESHGNTPELVNVAHQLRDGKHRSDFSDLEATEEVDLVIVGGGMAGLGAALEFSRSAPRDKTCLLLDNHPIIGGEAKENEFHVDGQRLIGPQGANGFFVPGAVADLDAAKGDPYYYEVLEIPREFSFLDSDDSKDELKYCRDNYGYLVTGLQKNTSVGHFFDDGSWSVDMFANRLEATPLSQESRHRLMTWFETGSAKQFGSDDDARRFLDTMSYETFLRDELGLGEEGARYADLFLASACGLGSDATSAYAAYQMPMPGMFGPIPDGMRRVSFPGGNSGFVRYFLKTLIPDAIEGGVVFEDIITGAINMQALDRPGQPIRMRTRSTAIHVAHDGDPASAGSASVIYVRNGSYHKIKARAVVMATGSWINRYVVRDMPEAHAEACKKFMHAPFLVANVALTNWRFLEKLGITAAIWNKQEGGFGFTCNIRSPMQVGEYRPPLDPSKPIILSFYTPFHMPGLAPTAQVAKGRAELLTTSYADYEGKILRQMLRLFGSAGFNPKRDVAGIILNRWGHAYSVPYPGFYGGADGTAPRNVLRQNYGRIAFAHSELDGLQHYGPAADEGRRAFGQLAGLI